MDDILETLGQYLPIYTPSMMSDDSFGNPSADSQMQVANYKTQLEQYLKDKERWQQEQDASRLGAVSARIFDNQKGLGAAQDLDNQTKYSNFMTRELVKAGPVAMSAVLKMMEQQQGTFARGGMPTNNEKDFAAMQANPGMEEYMRQKSQDAAPAAIQIAQMLSDPSVPEETKQNLRLAQKIEIDAANRGEVKHQEALGGAGIDEMAKGFAKEYDDINKSASSARAHYNSLRDIDNLLSDKYTGTGGEALLQAQKIAQAIGFDLPQDIAPKEAAAALAKGLALQMRNTADGGGMPGSLSDSDRIFLESMTPGLAMTEGGRKRLMEIAKKIKERTTSVANEADRYATGTRNSTLDVGWRARKRSIQDKWDEEDTHPTTPFATATPSAQPAGVPFEGQRQTSPSTGKTRVFTNGKWVVQ